MNRFAVLDSDEDLTVTKKTKKSSCVYEIYLKIWVVSNDNVKFNPRAVACSFHSQQNNDLRIWQDGYRHECFDIIVYCKDSLTKTRTLELTKRGQLIILGKYTTERICEVFDWSTGSTYKPLKRLNPYEILEELEIVDTLNSYGLFLNLP